MVKVMYNDKLVDKGSHLSVLWGFGKEALTYSSILLAFLLLVAPACKHVSALSNYVSQLPATSIKVGILIHKDRIKHFVLPLVGLLSHMTSLKWPPFHF